MARRLGDLLAAHRGQLIDLLAEIGRVGVERDQLVDEGVDLLLELALLLLLQRHQARRLLGLDDLQRLRRLQRQRGFCAVSVAVSVCVAMSFPGENRVARDWGFGPPVQGIKCIISLKHQRRKVVGPAKREA